MISSSSIATEEDDNAPALSSSSSKSGKGSSKGLVPKTAPAAVWPKTGASLATSIITTSTTSASTTAAPNPFSSQFGSALKQASSSTSSVVSTETLTATAAAASPPPRQPPTATSTSINTEAASIAIQTPLEMLRSTQSVVVVDAGPLIRGHAMNLHTLADRVVTCEEVIQEIRDSKARDNLALLPYKIETIEPSPECTKEVIEFARKTGDYQSLSLTDIKLIALVLTLEKIQNGDKNVRKTPVPSLKTQVALAAANAKKRDDEKKKRSKEGEEVDVDNTTEKKEEEKVEGKVGGGGSNEAIERDTKVENETSISVNTNINSSSNSNNSSNSNSNSNSNSGGELLKEDIATSTDDKQHSKAAQKRWRQKQKKLEADKQGLEAPAVEDSKLPSGSGSNPEKESKDEIDLNLESKPRVALGDLYSITPPNPPSEASLATRPIASGGSRIINTSSSSLRSEGGGAVAHGFIDDHGVRKPFVDNGKGWISSNNIAVVKTSINRHSGIGALSYKFVDDAIAEHEKGDIVIEEDSRVSCITNDFALQNVLIQMGLRLVSVDGQKISRVKQFVLRCIACFHIHYDTNRMFCEHCGINHLSKVAASINAETGQLKLHLKENYQVGTKGLVHSLPAAGKQGRFQGELLLRADQLKTGIWKQKVSRIKKDIASAFGEEITSDVGLHVNKGNKIVFGLGTKNPNQQRGRERRGKGGK